MGGGAYFSMVWLNCGEWIWVFEDGFKRGFLVMEKVGGFVANSGIWVFLWVAVTFCLEIGLCKVRG